MYTIVEMNLIIYVLPFGINIEFMYVCIYAWNVEEDVFLEHIYIIYVYILHTSTAHRVYTLYVHVCTCTFTM